MSSLRELNTNIDVLLSSVNTNLNYVKNLIVSVENANDFTVLGLEVEIQISGYAVNSIIENISKVLKISSSELPIFFREPNNLMVNLMGLANDVSFTLGDMISLVTIYSAFVETAIKLGGSVFSVQGSVVDNLIMRVGTLKTFMSNVENLSYILTNYSSSLRGGI